MKTTIPKDLRDSILGDDYQRVAEELEATIGTAIDWNNNVPTYGGIDMSFNFLYPHVMLDIDNMPDAPLEFKRVKGVPGYIGTDGVWFASKETIKMSKSASTESNMIGELSLESKLKAMTSERNYWKLRHELLEKYGANEKPKRS